MYLEVIQLTYEFILHFVSATRASLWVSAGEFTKFTRDLLS